MRARRKMTRLLGLRALLMSCVVACGGSEFTPDGPDGSMGGAAGASLASTGSSGSAGASGSGGGGGASGAAGAAGSVVDAGDDRPKGDAAASDVRLDAPFVVDDASAGCNDVVNTGPVFDGRKV